MFVENYDRMVEKARQWSLELIMLGGSIRRCKIVVKVLTFGVKIGEAT